MRDAARIGGCGTTKDFTLAIDPGPTQSAYCVMDTDCKPIEFAKIKNTELLHDLWALIVPAGHNQAVIEMIDSYGMAVGADVFETCVWIGRFAQELDVNEIKTELIKRRGVKLHHCGSARAKDGNIIQALVDRFAPGQPNRGKGTLKQPGWFHGFSADVWQAYALAVYWHDTKAAT